MYSRLKKTFFHEEKYIRKLSKYKMIKKIGFEKQLIKFIEVKKINDISFSNLIDYSKIELTDIEIDILSSVVENYCNHFFDILGTGWMSFDFNEKNEINWHKDFKSGFEFNSELISSDVRKSIPKGVDIKIPWEISRMYHFPQMAILALKIEELRDELILEYKNQILSFFSQNKIGYGVNYANAMEVSIRSINILIGYDIFNQIDSNNILDDNFKSILYDRLVRDSIFIVNNLEINQKNYKNGNHYLSNLVGLIYITSYLEFTNSKELFEFSASELLSEILNQFSDDGSLYECSTAYHKLSSELILFGLTMILNKGYILEEEIEKRVSKIYEFLLLIRTKKGEFIQIGDNDSGRLIKIIPRENAKKRDKNSKLEKNKIVFSENHLLIDNILSYFEAFLDNKSNQLYLPNYKAEKSFINSLLSRKINYSKDQNSSNVYFINKKVIHTDYKFKKITTFNIPQSQFTLDAAPDFGLYKYSSESVELYIRTTYDYKDKFMAHAHYDVLHFEIYINNTSIFSDSGSFVYTSSKEIRDLFRSKTYHNIPQYEEDMFKLKGFFEIIPNNYGEVIIASPDELGILVYFEGITHYRHFHIKNNRITVVDQSTHNFRKPKEPAYTSLGYGIKKER